MKIYYLILLVAGLAFGTNLYSQDINSPEKFRIVFYNLENFFDTSVDTNLLYNEFTPEGELHWTNNKYYQKTKNLYKVFQALSEWEGISIAGVCEIENENVLNNLLYNTPLKHRHYKYIHYNSSDKRGIDVALIYGEQFVPIYSQVFSILDKHKEKIDTRDILYVKGLLITDTVHVFVNHWTSRYRGLLESNDLRMKFSVLLKSKIDSIIDFFPEANIIAMGDFNDQAKDASIDNLTKNNDLFNLKASTLMQNASGTLKYREEWYIFDQILVSQAILKGNSLTVSKEGLKIFDKLFVLENDDKYLGYRPYRTNIGFRYHGGYSDHLPIYFDLIVK